MPVVNINQVTQTWLHSTWPIQVPQTWLDACIEWVTEEAGSVALPQNQLNKQVLDQWLLTDLRDLVHPVLPARISEAQKTELNGCYCLQLDSLLDVSQPAYSQLQRLRGSDCTNEEVTAVTQATQKPWEAKPTRMLMLQLTDGVQNLEGMEYRPIPALNANLPPGTKLEVKGRVVVRLGVLLLKPENVNVLGGEVEQLIGRHSQSRVLCRTLGLPEEDRQHEAEAEDQEVRPGGRIEGTLDSGYDSLNSQIVARNELTQTNQSENSRSSAFISRQSEANAIEVPDENFDDIPDAFDDFNDPEDFDVLPDDINDQPKDLENVSNHGNNHAAFSDDFNDHLEDFDDIPMEELDSILSPTDPDHLSSSEAMEQETIQQDVPRLPRPDRQIDQSYLASSNVVAIADDSLSSSVPKMARYEPPRAHNSPPKRSNIVKPNTSILNYLSILQAGIWPPPSAQVVRIQAFIVTLLGNLRSSGGEWKLRATISDGTGYLDVDLSDTLLENLIGFSASESRVLRKDPTKRGLVDAGIQKCQRELVDMCCVISVRLDPDGSGTVLGAEPLTDRECCELQRRVTERKFT
ncbi:recQ-mediated genome instability protein 1 [Trichomycterus rosablanca]|uniref:recQ-mediated genome instability protein 1 n=1 Tax=Trichomycterus rosablanca TaxID=2290929 RepID=UPI002F350C93